MHPHTEKETSILRQMRGLIGTSMIGRTEYFKLLIATVVKDGGVEIVDVARTLDCPVSRVEHWISGDNLPTPEECQRLGEKLMKLFNDELTFEPVVT